jgi:mono/diheme cytochrome c family protein
MTEIPNNTSDESQVAGVVAEFDSADALKAAAVGVRDQRFTLWDAHSPFPIHGMQRAMGMRPTPLPWLVLGAGVTGGLVALLMQWWMNAVDYPLIISGKPLFSLPANIPVTFELIVLFSALAAFGGAMMLGQLPQFLHFAFSAKNFHRVTTDGFFISIAATDAKFDEKKTVEFLESLGAKTVDVCTETTQRTRVPGAIVAALVTVSVLALLPPLLIALVRGGTSTKPPIHLVSDMDYQPRYNPQSYNGMFADRRAMRPPVPGTIAVGELDTNDHFTLGYDSESPSTTNADDPRDYYTTFPAVIRLDMKQAVTRGRQRYDIYCATCHGLVGNGQGITSIRALKKETPDWRIPTSLHVGSVRGQPVGQLFGTITNGKGKMPSYAAQIPAEDRWAIVLYVLALQRSQNATIEDFPKDIRSKLR